MTIRGRTLALFLHDVYLYYSPEGGKARHLFSFRRTIALLLRRSRNWWSGADEEGVVSLGRCGVCSGVPEDPFRQGGPLGEVVGGGVYTLPNCVMIFVRAYAAARRPREPDGDIGSGPATIRRLTPPSPLDKLKSIIGVVVAPTYVEGQSE